MDSHHGEQNVRRGCFFPGVSVFQKWAGAVVRVSDFEFLRHHPLPVRI
jgi:hypothetical protein